MDTKFQTSFIPKQPVTNAPRRNAPGMSIFFLVSFIVFAASVVAAGGLFLYQQKINNDITTGKAQLQENQNAFDQTTISTIVRLNDRLNTVSALLRQHLSFSNFFALLQNSTLQNVRFNNFSYAYDDSGKVTIAMGGQALSYETIALQAKAFTDPSLQGVFESPVFGNLNLDSSGNVTFSFSMDLDPNVISYYKTVTDASTAAASQAQIQMQQQSANGNAGTTTNQ